MSINIGGPVPRWQILGFTAAIGLALIAVPRMFLPEQHSFIEILDGIGIALLTSSILAFTIERWLRADLTKDIFFTAIGHHLPSNYREALKAEVVRLSAYRFLCENHILLIKIDPVDDDFVRISTTIERTIRNITQSSQKIFNHIHIDEWRHAERSQIHECSIEKLDRSGERASSNKTVTHDDSSISATTKEIKLKPNESAKLLSRSTEIKRSTDDLSFVFISPTVNPTIEISSSSDSFEFRASFGPDEETARKENYSNRQTLDGMYWPPQRMRIHWWRIKAD
jgi:hypothetical protein